MIEMTTVLVACGILMILSIEFTSTLTKREWGENSKSFF